MFFEEICKPRIADFARGGKIALASLMAMMEDVGSHQSAYVNDDVLSSSLNGSSWVCTNWRIRIIKAPVGMRDLTISTWARANRSSSTVLREYTICGSGGEQLVIAEAKFVRLDLKTGKPVRITQELYDSYEPEDKAVFEDEMQRLTPPENFDSVIPVVLRESDVDFNGHVHNIRYLDIAAAGLPEGCTALRDAYEINIAYRKALKESDDVYVKYAETENGCIISIDNSNGACCFIKTEKQS